MSLQELALRKMRFCCKELLGSDFCLQWTKMFQIIEYHAYVSSPVEVKFVLF